MNKITCDNCEIDYEVVHESDDEAIYCPFCGELNLPAEDEGYEYDDEWVMTTHGCTMV